MIIIPTRNFNDNVEFYLRKKKYKKIYSDIKTVTDELEIRVVSEKQIEEHIKILLEPQEEE